MEINYSGALSTMGPHVSASMQDPEATAGDSLQPRQSFYGGQNITYNSFQGSHLSPAAATHHSSSHNVNPTTRAQQLYAAVVNSSLGSPLSPRSNINAASLPGPPPSLPPSSAAPSLSPGTQITSGMYQPQPLGSPISQLHYQYQRESSSNHSEATRNSFQGPVAMDANVGFRPSSVSAQLFPRSQYGQTATLDADAFHSFEDTTRSPPAFYAGVNAGSQISVVSPPVYHAHDSLITEHGVHQTKESSSKKIGKASKNAGKFALKLAGSAVEIATGVPLPTEAIVSLVDIVAGIINRFGYREKNLSTISRADLEAVFQGAPNARYEEVIRVLMVAQAQRQKAIGTTPPGFSIQVLIDELRRVQGLANGHVRVVNGQAHPSFGPMGLMGPQTGSTGPVLMSNMQPVRPQIRPNTPATVALTIPEHGIYAYASGPGVEPSPARIFQASACLPSSHSQSNQVCPPMALPTHQVDVEAGARLCKDLDRATERLDSRYVSHENDAGPEKLPAEFLQQQIQLQTALLQQRHQMILLQQQQQQLMQILLEQQTHNQEIREERTLSAEFSSSAFVGSRPGSRNEALPLHLT